MREKYNDIITCTEFIFFYPWKCLGVLWIIKMRDSGTLRQFHGHVGMADYPPGHQLTATQSYEAVYNNFQ